MIAMLRCGPSNRPFAATEKAEMAEFTHCGPSGLMQLRLVLAQHALALAARLVLRLRHLS